MSNLKNNKGKIKAKEVLEEIGFDEITELSNSELVNGFGIIFISTPLDNADGKIIRGNSKTIIKINSNIDYPPRIRYILAHELGHYFLHEKLDIHNDDAKTLNWFNVENQAKRGIQEYEANDFASELLMPENPFKGFIQWKSFNPELIRSIAERFKTSLTSAIFRLLNLNSFPILIVYIHDGKVKYWSRSKSFKGWVKNINKLPPPEDSVAQEYLEADYDYIYKGDEKSQIISKSTWLELNNYEEDKDFFEYCIPYKKNKTIISVIWEKDHIY